MLTRRDVLLLVLLLAIGAVNNWLAETWFLAFNQRPALFLATQFLRASQPILIAAWVASTSEHFHRRFWLGLLLVGGLNGAAYFLPTDAPFSYADILAMREQRISWSEARFVAQWEFYLGALLTFELRRRIVVKKVWTAHPAERPRPKFNLALLFTITGVVAVQCGAYRVMEGRMAGGVGDRLALLYSLTLAGICLAAMLGPTITRLTSIPPFAALLAGFTLIQGPPADAIVES